MNRRLAGLVVAVGAAILSTSSSLDAAGQQRSDSASSSVSPQRALLDRYCVTCHNQKLRTAGLTLDAMDVDQVGRRAEIWEKVVRKLRAGVMPPAGRPRPEKASYDGFASWLETELDRAAVANPNPGRTEPFHRLNRTEYQNAIRDLLTLDGFDVTLLLPADDSSYGFDNIAGILKVSPTLMERYLSAAQKISRLAVGDPSIPLMVDTYRLPPELAQDDRFEGLPFGTRGGTAVRRHFPLDAEYGITVELAGAQRPPEPHQLEVTVDGERVQLFTVGGRPPEADRGGGTRYAAPPDAALQVRVPIKAGPRDIGIAFVKKTSAQVDDLLQPFLKPGRGGRGQQPYLGSVTISGPYEVNGPGDTPSRRRIFVCRPASPAEELECVNQILSTLARRAYRRPVAEADLQLLLPFYTAGRADGGFERGNQRALERLLMSPEFLFRIERDPSNVAPNTPYRISDLELASRLSFFFWSSIPDDELLEVARRGELSTPPVLDQQVRRMLADPRSQALVSNFAGQWLYLRNLAAASPDPRLFPDFDESLRRAFRRETELFFANLLREDRSVLELLDADYTFVNERLAKHYGIPNVAGSHFRRVTLTDAHRRGLLGHGSVLTVTSYSTRTSPVLRGKWVLENILGTPPPPPPPDVPALQEKTAEGKPLSMRDAMVQHRANPVCASCHAMMDPLGFALENFDAVGRWRTRGESGTALDVSGSVPSGTRFEGVAGLREALMREPKGFVTIFTEKLLTYALGRGVEYYDAPAVRSITREAAFHEYGLASLIVGIVKSPPFQMRRSAAAEVKAAP